MKSATLLALLTLAGSAIARPVCYEDKVTDALTCYDRASLKERDGIRYAAMMEGGPNRVRPNGFTFAINCKTGNVHLKDADGVSFGGGDRASTPTLDAIVGWVCKEKVRRPGR